MSVMDNEWQFKEVAPAGWIWRCVRKSTGEVLRASARPFIELNDCVEDAKRSGFKPVGVQLTSRDPAIPPR